MDTPHPSVTVTVVPFPSTYTPQVPGTILAAYSDEIIKGKKKMTDETMSVPFKVAVVIDGIVVDTIMCDERSWAMFTSNPTFVDLTDAPDQLQVGDTYDVIE